MDGAWLGLPGQAAQVAIALQTVGEVPGLLARSDELHDGDGHILNVIKSLIYFLSYLCLEMTFQTRLLSFKPKYATN